MPNKLELRDYEPVTPSPQAGRAVLLETAEEFSTIRPLTSRAFKHVPLKTKPTKTPVTGDAVQPADLSPAAVAPTLRRGHSLSYAGIFTFTFLVYFRPYELFPSLAWLSRSALIVAVLTLAFFIPTQLGLENRITAKLLEVKIALALLFTALLSVPLALEPVTAFQTVVEFFKVIAIFVVTVNVVRTEKRLRGLLQLVLLSGCVLSFAAFSDYAQGNLVLQGRRIAGLIGGLFSNPNDLALHLVTMIPISLALGFGSRRQLTKVFYLICSFLLVLGLLATFSRGGFIGFSFMVAFLAGKMARRHRVIVGGLALALVLAVVALAPASYRSRLATTSDDSAVARTDELKRSLLVAARHPLLGVGMGNYILYSNSNKATHNAYTQVAAELGVAAFLIYLWFLISPFKRLRQLEQATGKDKRKPPVYYLALGLQASLIGYAVASFFASVAFLWYAYYLVAFSVCLSRIYSHLDGPSLSLNSNPKFVLHAKHNATAIRSNEGVTAEAN
jgi:O-antigen ligase